MIDIKPVGGYKPLELQKIIQRQLDIELKKTKADFETATKTWQHKPVFEVERGLERAAVFTRDEIFGYVDLGTKPHEIRPRFAKALRFNSLFQPKTQPNRLKSGAGASSPPVVFAQVVHHPGNEPRNISILIGKRSQRRFVKALDSAIIRERNLRK